MSDPPPASLVFLSDLGHLPPRTKVRFLGCVERYDSATGTLFLAHKYPEAALHQVTARVNVDHVLESTRNVELQTGAWINVIGYVSERDEKSARKHTTDATPTQSQVAVQALMLWNAGTLRLDEYEKALLARKECGAVG